MTDFLLRGYVSPDDFSDYEGEKLQKALDVAEELDVRKVIVRGEYEAKSTIIVPPFMHLVFENAKVIADLTSRMDKNYPNESDKIYIEGRNAVLQGDIVLFHTRHTVIENLSITGDVTLNFTRDARLEALDISGTLTFGRGASKIIAQDLRLGSAIMDCNKNGEDAIGREPTIRSIVLRDAKATNGVKLIAAEDYGFLNVQIDNIEGSVTIGKEGDTLPSQKYYNLTIYNIKGDIIKHADAKHATFK